MATESHTTAAVEDYAKAIYALQTQRGHAVNTNAIASRLGVTAASASNMAKKLSVLGRVEHVPYKGVRLTEAGQRVALEVLRHHRLLERYLADQGIAPGDDFEIVDKQPCEGPVSARFGKRVHVLGGGLARAMRAEVTGE